MSVRKIILFIPFFSWGSSFSQAVHAPIFSAYLDIGAYSIDHTDVFSFQANQAALAEIKNFSAGIYSERRFMLKELSLHAASLALPTHSGNFGWVAKYFGSANYHETELGLAYAKKLGGKIDAGLQFNYYTVKIAGYGNASTIHFEAGAILHLTEKLNAGIHIYNPAGGKFGKNGEEKLPSVYSAGIGYDASEIFFFSFEIEKEENQPVNINGGFQYKFFPQLQARGGVSTANSSMYLGCGICRGSFRLDVVSTYHQQLGFTPGLMLLFHFNKDQN